ncbi:hypothetical protein VOLCADRAFT_89029 [Volvox carteri f. nagariensis]|uniref:Uncharacterized protein n=1 Tax=Volvox carteri f. nagariensis TaxID=3068 RepID=D8TQL6_VOLCA|nr:uncharacterized protein VOLCADRAFT_89029 [Volvox carteri f. nagariensis]EFJ50173.1 hypothetical protein VOLCADRAFT_89029 [Volvox carteri f. nagariensis]|eukprot:XP_002948793.1 hypothetical protein VOLCADRAFT_89029 [Volvox carteri f. nagariensis]
MGQFYSREFDGDPYIDLMRSLPERELVWWAQKVIWLAEGFTFVDHFARTYPRLFQHKCPRCNGAGVLTCPGCAGTKVPLGLTGSGRRALLGPPAVDPATNQGRDGSSKPLNSKLQVFGALPAAAPMGAGNGDAATATATATGVVGSCRMCGDTCNWDVESEWMDRWREWESRLAYYDKATAPLMDEWYEDVINAGNLEEDTPPVEDDPPGPEVNPGREGKKGEVTGRWADDDRLMAKDKKRFAAIVKRFGHPYDADATLGYQIVDPTASMGENIWNMAQVYNSTPPELNPWRTAHFAGRGGGGGPGSSGSGGIGGGDVEGGLNPALATQAALDAFDQEIVQEAAIMQNLEAAVQDLPKPHRFLATAGTIPCTECSGLAWQYSVMPNTERLFGVERPTWADRLARLERYWTPKTLADPSRTGQVLPYGEHGLRSLLAAAQGGEEGDLVDAVVGRAPESTARYRRDLDLLVAAPELRDARLRVPAGLNTLGLYLQTNGQETGGSRCKTVYMCPAALGSSRGYWCVASRSSQSYKHKQKTAIAREK